MSDEPTVPESYEPGAGPHRVPRLAWRDTRGPRAHAVEGRVAVGSASSAALVVAHRSVSRLHAEIEAAPGGLWVRDLGSMNGTWVGALRLREGVVPFGASLRLGSVEVLVGSAEAPPPERWPSGGFGGLLGGSRPMRELFARLARVAASDAAALIEGETGAGKELCALALHQASARREGPFVVVDCGALPEPLLEIELFGHAEGAFPGAAAARAGAFEQASGGTLFLDGVGELPLTAQPKLLRVLESKSVRRLGEAAPRPLDLRVVSATHRDLLGMVACGAFREDLYFRLAALPLRVPPLRERPDDIADLLGHFLGRPAREALSAAVVDELERLPWLGNVRELRNFAERVLAFGPEAALALARARGQDPVTRPSAAPPPPPAAAPPEPGEDARAAGPFHEFREAWLARGEAYYVARLLERHGGNVANAAREAQVNRSHLYRLVKKYRP
ncbi:MAG TPA: sigma 54-interacting transcriptional regulator [Polyangiaceae bacterium]|nr:sigma 54-interacting transcriptional regulator [Polyangiaceae bacterium]